MSDEKMLDAFDWATEHRPDPPSSTVDYSTTDVFHQVLSYLSIPDLLAAEQVSKSWRAAIRRAGDVWRGHADKEVGGRDVLVAVNVVNNEKAKAEASGSPQSQPTLWRRLCADRLSAIKAWERTTPRQHGKHIKATAYAELPSIGGIVALHTNGSAVMCDRLLDSHQPMDMSLTAIGSTGKYFVALRSTNGLGEHPPPPPTTLEVYRAVQGPGNEDSIPAPGGHLERVRTLETTGMWGFSLHVSEAAKGTVVALLAAPARLVNPDTQGAHWVAGSKPREVHIWVLEDETRHPRRAVPVPEAGRNVRSFAVAGSFVVIPVGTNLHVYMISTGQHVAVPLTPLGASLAGIINTYDRPYDHILGNDVATPNDVAAVDPDDDLWYDAHEVINFGGNGCVCPKVAITSRHLLYVSDRGALGIIYNFAFSLPRLFNARPDHTAMVASSHTVMYGGWPAITALEVCGDRVACSAGRRNSSVFTFHARDIPEPTRTMVHFPEHEAQMWRNHHVYMTYWRQLLEPNGLRIARVHTRGVSLVPGSLMRHSLTLAAERRHDELWVGETLLLRWGDVKMMLDEGAAS